MMNRPEPDVQLPGRQEVIACVTTAEARGAVQRAASGRFDARFFSSTRELAQAAATGTASMIVWEVEEGAENEIELIVRAISSQREAVPILVRLDLTRAAARQVLVLMQHAHHLNVSLRCHDDLAIDIGVFRAQPAERRAYEVILKRLVPLVPERARDVVIAATLAGHRRTSVQSFARLFGWSVRALQGNLRAARVVPAKNLLGWMVALNSLWRLDALAWGSKQACVASGFASRDAWAHYIARHIGARPAQLMRDGGFASLLERCERELMDGRGG